MGKKKVAKGTGGAVDGPPPAAPRPPVPLTWARDQALDIQDVHGRWFEGRVVQVNSGVSVKVHYRTWPDEYDEEVEWASPRLAPAYTQVPNWRRYLGPSQAVESLNAVTQRWTTFLVSNIDATGGVGLAGHGGEEGTLDRVHRESESLAAAGTHLGTPMRGEDEEEEGEPQSRNPNGTARAMSIADAANRRGDAIRAFGFYRELLEQGLLPSASYEPLFTLVDSGLVIKPCTVEGRRLKEAMAAHVLDHAYSRGHRTEGLVQGGRAKGYAHVEMRWEAEEGESEGEESDGEEDEEEGEVGMTPQSTIRALLSARRSFRVHLGPAKWEALPPAVRQRLAAADALEEEAGGAGCTLATRCLLYAEACRTMEGAMETCNAVAPAVHYRLARTYVNGLGVDVTEPELQDSMDFQAEEYLLGVLRPDPPGAFLLSLLLFLGRCRISLRSPADRWSEAVRLLEGAVKEGYPPAMFWKARLLVEGVLDSKDSREMMMHAACKLFRKCVAVSFLVEESKANLSRIEALLKLPFANNMVYDLGLHVLSHRLTESCMACFPRAVYHLVKQEAAKSHLPFPTDGPKASPDAEWCKELSRRLLRFTHSSSGDDHSGGKRLDKLEVADAMSTLWARQQFNQFPAYTPPPPPPASPPKSTTTANPPPPASPPKTTAFALPKKWEIVDVKSVLDRVREVGHDVAKLCAVYNGTTFPPEQAEGLLKVVDDKVKGNDKRDSTYTGLLDGISLDDTWQACLTEAHQIASRMRHPPSLRFLRERVGCLTDLPTVRSHIRGLTSLEAAIDIAVLARRLSSEARESFPQTEKHVHSARALMTFASSEEGGPISLEVAMQRLDKLAVECLSGLSAPDGYVARIGYHTIVENARVAKFVKSATQQASNLPSARVQQLHDSPQLNWEWRTGIRGPSLLQMFFDFQKLVEHADKQLRQQSEGRGPSSSPQPSVCLPSLTYQDPWSFLLTTDMTTSTADVVERATQLARETGLKPTEALDTQLTSEVGGLMRRMGRHMPPTTAENIMDRLSGYAVEGARVLLKTKFLHLLRTAPGVNWDTGLGLPVLAQQIAAGLEGRCPDGISSFCDDYVAESVHRQAQDRLAGVAKVTSRLIVAVALLLHQSKLHFIRAHLSRHASHYEQRTVCSLTLTNMLTLPLSLPCAYSHVKYPRYAYDGMVGGEEQLAHAPVAQRFIYGGQVVFDYDGRVSAVDVDPAASLQRLVHMLRGAIVRSETGGEGVNPREGEGEDQDLLPKARLQYTISEEVVEDFVKQDVILSRYYDEAKAGEFTRGNLFFHALEDDSGDDATPQSTDTRPLIARLLKDAAVVRLLQVCQYARVPPAFYESLSSSWTAPPFTLTPPPLPPIEPLVITSLPPPPPQTPQRPPPATRPQVAPSVAVPSPGRQQSSTQGSPSSPSNGWAVVAARGHNRAAPSNATSNITSSNASSNARATPSSNATPGRGNRDNGASRGSGRGSDNRRSNGNGRGSTSSSSSSSSAESSTQGRGRGRGRASAARR